MFTVWPLAASNSYSAVADADTYFSDRLGTDAWTAAITATKEKALVTATRMLDRQTWEGTKTVTTPEHPLAWSRTGVTDKYGNDVDPDTLPAAFLAGVYELALALLVDLTIQEVVNTGNLNKRLKAGSVEIEYFRPSADTATRFPTVIQELLGQFLAGSETGTLFGEAFGADECHESFFEQDNFALHTGYY